MDNRCLAGAFMFVGGMQFAIGMVLAEILYPAYNVSGNYISDLGATCRETCTIYQPSAFIFNTSAIFLGIFILLGSYCIWLKFKNYLISILIGFSGLGALSVGLFPETTGTLHLIVILSGAWPRRNGKDDRLSRPPLGDRVWGIFDVLR